MRARGAQAGDRSELALRLARVSNGGGATVLEESVDHFEDGALLGDGDLFDLLEAFQEPEGALSL